MLKFPTNEVDYALFTGEEAEGPNQGLRTLFVVGDVPVKEISKALDDERLDRVYFGAGGRFDYNPDTVKLCVRVSSGKQFVRGVTIESPHVDFKLLHVLKQFIVPIWVVPIVWHGVFNIQTLDIMSEIALRNRWALGNIYFKIDADNRVAWMSGTGTYVNTYDADSYETDKIILQKKKEE